MVTKMDFSNATKDKEAESQTDFMGGTPEFPIDEQEKNTGA